MTSISLYLSFPHFYIDKETTAYFCTFLVFSTWNLYMDVMTKTIQKWVTKSDPDCTEYRLKCNKMRKIWRHDCKALFYRHVSPNPEWKVDRKKDFNKVLFQPKTPLHCMLDYLTQNSFSHTIFLWPAMQLHEAVFLKSIICRKY